MTLATKPAGEVIVDVSPSDARVTLSSSDPRFKTIAPPGEERRRLRGQLHGRQLERSGRGRGLGHTAERGRRPAQHLHHLHGRSEIEARRRPNTRKPRSEEGPLYIEVLSDHEPGAVVQAPENMVITKCGNSACTIPGAGSSYTLRLTEEPKLPVNVALEGDGQTVIGVGGRISYQPVSTKELANLFSGAVVDLRARRSS